ncbi:MAG: hypothetical protein H6741_04535 [Alphaproteobacteria bacterium]|nr:hypothetical protein [Alphaproteobacteria bacterium]MCB9791974.1 hypothetical protein [Alphaproteobacteria bacterium]
MPEPRPDQVVVEVMSSGTSWITTVDLETGLAERQRDHARGPRPLPPATLTRLREAAQALHAEGDQVYRTQFVSGEVHFRVTLGGRTVTQSFYDEGGGFLEPRDTLFGITRDF